MTDIIARLVNALQMCIIILDGDGNLETRIAANGPTLREVIDRALALVPGLK